MGERKISPLYRLIKAAVRAVYPKIKVVGEENLPPEPVVYVGNHSQMNGPIACELYTPGEHYIWCAGQMMDKKEVPAYAYQDFWSEKPKAVRWFYKLLSYIIAPLSQLVFTNANTIGVYHDTRIITTFKKTVTALQEGASVVIFPEHHVPRNNIICEFQDRFIDVAKLYYKRTGKALAFVPQYLAPSLKTMYLANPSAFSPTHRWRKSADRHLRLFEGAGHGNGAWHCQSTSSYLIQTCPKNNIPAISHRRPPMRKPEIDYRTFRLSKLNDPQFAHLKLLGGWIGYFIMYFLTENLIPEESCHVVHCWIDDLIPFCEWFLIPYVFWYFLIVFTLLYLMLYHVEGFKRFQIFIIVTQVVAMAIYIIYPNRQDMRPEVFPRENFLTAIIGFIYKADTPTGVCPSLPCGLFHGHRVGVAEGKERA